MPVLRPNAAGVDIGSREIWIAIPADRDEQPVRRFSTFTADLHRAADWLQARGIETVAMESTGVYWIPFFQILEDRGIEPCLVNAHHVKNVPGRKTDVKDCQWLQFLHSVGLLSASFRPQQQICALRALERHRDSWVKMAATHVQHMQKALDQMNLQLHHVISDITGQTGLAIIDAILSGERNPQKLAQNRDRRIKAEAETIAQALVGDYREELLFTLKQAVQTWRHYQQQMAEADQQIRGLMQKLETLLEPAAPQAAASEPDTPRKRGRPRGSNTADAQMQRELQRIFGVDLTAVPGLEVATVRILLSEIGPDFSAFPNSPAFCSWLTLCPNNSISGGKTLSSRTRKSKNRLARALRLSAQALQFSHSALGGWYRRIKGRLGPAEANTAGAHKLARIIFHLIATKQAYSDELLNEQNQQHSRRREAYIRKQAQAIGYKLVPITASV
jgi:transposase